MSNNLPSRFAYFDTNILSDLAKDASQWTPLKNFLQRDNLYLAISGAQVAELCSDTRIHKPLNEMLTSVPSAIIKNPDTIFDEEVKAHPSRRLESLFQYDLTLKAGSQDFEQYLSSPELVQTRQEQRQSIQVWEQRLDDLKSNFSPSKSGKFTADQAKEFAWYLTLQQLMENHLPFLQENNDASNLNFDVFLSVQILGFVIFYKYYLAGRNPKPSDFGDTFHLHAMPYSKLVIVERDMCNILNQIKKKFNVLNGVVIENIDFLKDWSWTEEESENG